MSMSRWCRPIACCRTRCPANPRQIEAMESGL